MPIVFVHGVNNRDGEAYRENEDARNGFLREIVAPALGMNPDRVRLLSPYWGKFGVQFAWNLAVLPNPADKFESFGGDAESQALGRVAGLLAESKSTGDVVADAQRDFPETVDLLYASAMSSAKSEVEARDLARSYLLSAEYACKNLQPAWLATATLGNFADQLNYAAEASHEESFGAGGILASLKEGLSRLVTAAPDAATAAAGRLLRKKLNTTVTRFAGDAFVYLARRGTKVAPGAIVTAVLDALRDAQAGRTAEDNKLIVIAHSFGGEIMYDIMTHFDPSIKLDYLITVGSQVGLFEEMKLYLESRPEIPPDAPAGRIQRPPSVAQWLNVFDTNDVLSYRLEPVVDDVHDFHYDTGFSSLSAHGGYFMRPSFYKRLAERLSRG
jgi:hypothetical protein